MATYRVTWQMLHKQLDNLFKQVSKLVTEILPAKNVVQRKYCLRKFLYFKQNWGNSKTANSDTFHGFSLFSSIKEILH